MRSPNAAAIARMARRFTYRAGPNFPVPSMAAASYSRRIGSSPKSVSNLVSAMGRKQPAARTRDRPAFCEYRPAPRERHQRPAADGLPFVGAERVPVEEILPPDQRLIRQVGYPEVGVESHRHLSFAREPESPGHVRRGGGGDDSDVDRSQVRSLEQQPAGRLAARGPPPKLEEVVAYLEPGRAGRVVGHDHRQAAVPDHLPQPLAIRGGPERRRAFAERTQPFEVLFRVEQVMGTGFVAPGDARGLRLTDPAHALDGAHVADVAGAARLLRQRDRARA